MMMKEQKPYLIVHRSASEIGGNCIEIGDGHGHRILLDVGLPLENPSNGEAAALPSTLFRENAVDGILLSHAHLDHYGLISRTPNWPVYCGELTRRMIGLAEPYMRSKLGVIPEERFKPFWKNGVPFDVGPFRVTPYLADHSEPDAYMLLIELRGEKPYRILYTGDFRDHGRKSWTIKHIIKECTGKVDLLILEGTGLNHQGNEPPNEEALQHRFKKLFSETKGLVFVSFSSQNIDRIVTLFKACRSSGRTFVIDSYIDKILKAANKKTLPQSGWKGIVVDYSLGRDEPAHGKGFILNAERITKSRSKWVVVVRTGLLKSLEKRGVTPTPDDKWCWSLWKGYLKPDAAKVNPVQEWFEAVNCPPEHLHTSGHASKKALQEFAAAINPAKLLFVHRDEKSPTTDFPNVMPCDNGEVITLE